MGFPRNRAETAAHAIFVVWDTGVDMFRGYVLPDFKMHRQSVGTLFNPAICRGMSGMLMGVIFACNYVSERLSRLPGIPPGQSDVLTSRFTDQTLCAQHRMCPTILPGQPTAVGPIRCLHSRLRCSNHDVRGCCRRVTCTWEPGSKATKWITATSERAGENERNTFFWSLCVLH